MTACTQEPQFNIKGTISGIQEKTTLCLEAATLSGIQPIDSTQLTADGSFAFSAAAPTDNPEFYILRIGNQRIHFCVDSTETLSFNIRLKGKALDYDVEGSENATKIQEISRLQNALQQRIIAIERNEDLLPGDALDSISSLVKAYKERMKTDYIFSDPRKAYAYFAVCQSITDLTGTYQLFDPLNNRDDVRCYATVATAWDGQWPDAPRTEQLCNMAVKGMGNTATPQRKEVTLNDSLVHETGIIDVELPDVNSHLRRLSDLKGKVVMLDFTLYGAQESAQRTRIMRDLYNSYKGQGFEIYQVSLDDDMHFWKFSVEKLPWICVHETNGTATKSYVVTQLPTFFLINRDNEIVRRSDDIKDLEAEIRQLL